MSVILEGNLILFLNFFSALEVTVHAVQAHDVHGMLTAACPKTFESLVALRSMILNLSLKKINKSMHIPVIITNVFPLTQQSQAGFPWFSRPNPGIQSLKAVPSY